MRLICQSVILACGILLWASFAHAAEVADGDAFVRVSSRDARYFELSNGSPYIPIGFNLVSAPNRDEIESVVKMMAAMESTIAVSGPISRRGVWRCVAAENMVPKGWPIYSDFLRSAGSMVSASKYVWSTFVTSNPSGQNGRTNRCIIEQMAGHLRVCRSFSESPAGIAQFKGKIAWYAEQVGDEPAVFAWELWNEMNAVRGQWQPWTEVMLPELRRQFPNNLVIQSLGSFDRDSSREPYQQLCRMPGNDIAQVHRYLDLGAQLPICHGPVDLLAADAVAELRRFRLASRLSSPKPGR